MNTIFVYGSLREGHGNHMLYLKDAEKVGDGTINAKRNGPIHVSETDDPEEIVHGEVYRVSDNTLSAIDGLEGYREDIPDDEQAGYVRTETTVSLESGEEITAEYYPVKNMYTPNTN